MRLYVCMCINSCTQYVTMRIHISYTIVWEFSLYIVYHEQTLTIKRQTDIPGRVIGGIVEVEIRHRVREIRSARIYFTTPTSVVN